MKPRVPRQPVGPGPGRYRLDPERRSHTLTAAQIALLQQLAAGYGVKQIAYETQRGENSVVQQAKRMRAKLGAKTNPEAVAIGFRRGLLT